MNEFYPTLLQMIPWNKKYPITWKDGWNIFRGPKIGEVAPDEYLVVQSNQPQTSLHTLMSQTFTQSSWSGNTSEKQFFVIFFDGMNHGDTTTYAQILAHDLESQFPSVDALVVTNYYDAHSYDTIDNIVGDIDGNCAKKYWATWQSIYVMDRNLSIVWKSSGFLQEKLYLYLNSVSNSL